MTGHLVLVTRPRLDAQRTAARLEELGLHPLIASVMEITPTGAALPPGPFDALLVTSANAVACLAEGRTVAELGIARTFAVGARTAQAAEEAGFAPALSADGDRHDLAALIARSLQQPSRLLMAVGRDYHPDLVQSLIEAGHDPVVMVLYESRPLEILDGAAVEAFRSGAAGYVLHYSPASARAFLACVDHAGAREPAKRLHHIALSRAVADVLWQADMTTVDIAARPDEEALLEALAGVVARKSGVAAGGEPLYISEANAKVGSGDHAMTDERDGDQSARKQPRSPRRRHAPIIEAKAEGVEVSSEPKAPAAAVVDEAVPDAVAASAEAPAGSLVAGMQGPNSEQAQPPGSSERAAGPAPGGQRKPSLIPIAAAGLIGGLIGAGGIGLLSSVLRPSPQPGERIASIETRLGAFAPKSSIDTLNGRIDGLDPKIQAAISAGHSAQSKLDVLSSRLDAVEQRLAAPAPAGEAAAQMDPAVSAAGRQASDQLDTRLKRVEAEIAAVEPKLARSENELGKRLDNAEGKLTVLERDASGSEAASQTARLLRMQAVATALHNSLETGAPYKAELDGLRVLGGDAGALAVLAPLATTGAPTPRTLAETYAPLAEQVASAKPADEAKSSFVDRLAANVSGLVKIRPIGEASGNDPAALSARIEAALARGDLRQALEAWKALPETSKRPAKAWGRSLETRAAAQDAADGLVTQTTQALTRSGT